MGLTEPSHRQTSKTTNTYLKYSGLAVQLLVVIGVFGWLGYLLDNYLKIQFPAFMLLFGVLGFGGMLYQIYKSLNKDNP